MFSAKKRLDKAYKEAHRVSFDDNSKYILFSDCHRGDNSFADDFANNRNIYFHHETVSGADTHFCAHVTQIQKRGFPITHHHHLIQHN